MSNLKRIGIYLGSAPERGGAFRYNYTLLNALLSISKDHFEIIAFYEQNHWEKYLPKDSVQFKKRKIKISFYSKVSSKIYRIMKLPTWLWRSLIVRMTPIYYKFKEPKCDLWIFPSQEHWSFHLPFPSVAVVHDLMHLYEPFPEVVADGEFSRREHLYKQVSKYSSAILVDSEVGKQHVLESYKEARENTIFPLPFIAPISTIEEKEEEYPNLPEKYFFYPAQFWQHKNHKNLILALKKICQEHPEVKLLLVGSKRNGYQETLQLVQDEQLDKNVLFEGYVEDRYIPSLYKNAFALIMPTFFGPTNIPPLEAFKYGCPVAISNTYGMPEQAAGAALLFDPANVEEIYLAMKQLLTDDRSRLSFIEKGKRHHLNWQEEQFTERFKQIITTLGL